MTSGVACRLDESGKLRRWLPMATSNRPPNNLCAARLLYSRTRLPTATNTLVRGCTCSASWGMLRRLNRQPRLLYVMACTQQLGLGRFSTLLHGRAFIQLNKRLPESQQHHGCCQLTNCAPACVPASSEQPPRRATWRYSPPQPPPCAATGHGKRRASRHRYETHTRHAHSSCSMCLQASGLPRQAPDAGGRPAASSGQRRLHTARHSNQRQLTSPSASSCLRRSIIFSPRLLYNLAICCANAAQTRVGVQASSTCGLAMQCMTGERRHAAPP